MSDKNFEIAENLFFAMVHAPEDADVMAGVTAKFWTDGEKILSKDGAAINRIADLLDDVAGYGVTSTGYYDPEEDERTGCTDKYTGYYRLEIAE